MYFIMHFSDQINMHIQSLGLPEGINRRIPFQ